MSRLAYAADLRPVTSSAGDDSDRGADIKRRFDALGLTDREWHRLTGIDRKTLNRAISNAPGVRPSTYTAVESYLDKLEAHAQGTPTARAVGDPGDDLVEFTVEGHFGVRAVVKGPIRDIDKLQEAVGRLIAGMDRPDPER